MNSSSVENQKKTTFIYMIFKNYHHWEQKKNLSFHSRKKLRDSFTYYSQLFAMNIPNHRVLLPPKSQDSH